MSSISIKTGLGRQKRAQQKEVQKSEATQTFPVFGIMVMIMTLALLSLMLFAQPAAPLSNLSSNSLSNSLSNYSAGITPQTLSLSGAITSRIALEDAVVQCSSTGVVINGTAPMAYTVNYAMGNKAASNNLSIDGTNTLTLSINSATASGTPNVFTAYDGVVFAQNGRTYINANLTNNAGQPLYVNATVACN